jgi:hypothetical protein
MVPLLKVIPQWSHQMSSRLTKGWKRIREKWVLGRWRPDELQEELIKEGGKGTSLGWSHQES